MGAWSVPVIVTPALSFNQISGVFAFYTYVE